MIEVGNKVTISGDLEMGFLGSIFINSEMVALSGTEQEVLEVRSNNYLLKDNPYCWPHEAFLDPNAKPVISVNGYVRVNLTDEIVENFSTGYVEEMYGFHGKVYKVSCLSKKGEHPWATLEGSSLFWDLDALEVIPMSEFNNLKTHFESLFGDKGLYRVKTVDGVKQICKISLDEKKGNIVVTACLSGKNILEFENLFEFYDFYLDKQSQTTFSCVERNK